MNAMGIIPEVFEARTPLEIISYCNNINKVAEPNLVIVAGGDGTFNAVVNGLQTGSSTVALLPFGTSNVLAAELGIHSIDDALSRIEAGNTSPLSVGVLEMLDRTLRFVLMAGIGVDGAVVRDVWPLGKKLFRQGAYVLSALLNSVQWDGTTFRLNGNQREIFCHTAIICNVSRYGGNFVLSPNSTPFKSGLSAVCITKNTRRSYLNCAWDLYRNRVAANSDIVRLDASTFEIKGRRPIQIDGDFVGYGPARIHELNDFVRIIV